MRAILGIMRDNDSRLVLGIEGISMDASDLKSLLCSALSRKRDYKVIQVVVAQRRSLNGLCSEIFGGPGLSGVSLGWRRRHGPGHTRRKRGPCLERIVRDSAEVDEPLCFPEEAKVSRFSLLYNYVRWRGFPVAYKKDELGVDKYEVLRWLAHNLVIERRLGALTQKAIRLSSLFNLATKESLSFSRD